MMLTTETLDFTLASGYRRALDFLELAKPRVVLMVLVTTLVGFYLGSELVVGYAGLIETLLGTALAAGGTLALNEYLERGSDAMMVRTRGRPLPDGRIQPTEALVFGVLVMGSGLLILAVTVNGLSALITAFIAGSYLCIYTPLKQRSLLCGIVGAVPGALPPVIGWSAARGALGIEAWVLFAIMFLWQVPHTLAIATLYRDDFAKAGIQFLPVVEPDGKSTGRQVISHCLALLVVSLLPTLLGFAGSLYFVAAILLGTLFLTYAVGLAISHSSKAARRLLFASLFYLPVLLVVMALNRAPF
ncbi:MAG: heme o synthase [Candidatus Binatia bacterium]